MKTSVMPAQPLKEHHLSADERADAAIATRDVKDRTERLESWSVDKAEDQHCVSKVSTAMTYKSRCLK